MLITLVMVEDTYFLQYLHRLRIYIRIFGLHYGVISVQVLVKGLYDQSNENQ